jgi:hypothetical protein
MEEEEPIRIVSREEFARLRASIIAERNQTQQQKGEQPPEPTPSAAVENQAEAVAPLSPESMKLGSDIWEMRKRGLSRWEISNRLSIPIDDVGRILSEFQAQLYPDAGAAIAQRLAIDDGRLEDLFRTYLPIATAGPVEVKKVDRKGREYTELDTETPIKAAGIVLGAIQRRIQLAVACRPESAGIGTGPRAINVVAWLNQVLPSVSQVVNQVNGGAQVSRPRQTLTLECEAEADLPPERSCQR